METLKLAFRSGAQITQKFGERAELYFTKTGMPGHNGIDLAPVEPQDKNVLAVEKGVVFGVNLDPNNSSNFGIYVIIYNYETHHRWIYAHLEKTDLVANQIIEQGDIVGAMGNTGLSEAPHLHLGLRLLDANGYPIYDGEFQGFVDPLLILLKLQGDKMIPIELYAKTAFDAYKQFVEGKTYDGKPIPTWEELAPKIREAWTVAVKAAMDLDIPKAEQ